MIGGIQQETLSPELVTNPEMYINSTWFGFSQWYSRWWESDNLPDRGYCEYYLARCCGYSDITMDMSLPYKEKADKKPYLAIYLGHEARSIIDAPSLLSLLDENHIEYELLGDSDPIERSLSIIGNAELLVTTASAFQWYAVATNTPTLLISGQFDPRLTMPDFATTLNEKVDANVLVNDICELLEKAK
ncbi:hypothetical protein [Alteromonas sp. KUL49]|uniref:hypothetical protein n=1 Tax=Alteromonas sp. KUL49 TaxID=2480798 RepID=UPI00102F27A4|nr:hypothetical protein [Alteromonas sp. KUL49]